MVSHKWSIAVTVCVVLLDISLSSPMFYKKNNHDNYEPDLVAISSTVIPLSVYEVSYGLGGKATDSEYKIAYMKHLHKKVRAGDDDPDTLITLNGKYYEKKNRD